MKPVLAVALLFLLPLTYAQLDEVMIYADINADNTVAHELDYYFSVPLGPGVINYTLSHPIRNIEVSDDAGSLAYKSTGDAVYITLQAPATHLKIKYTTDNVVFISGDTRHFFTEFDFDDAIKELRVTVVLPEGYTIQENFYRPTNGETLSDGRRILIKWTELDALGRYTYSVNFTNPNENTNPFIFIAAVLALIVVLGFVHFRRKMRESFMKGFREDEKRTIEFLQLRKTALQSDLQKTFGFSRAKSTRIVMNLEHKGLVRKQKYGRTNKLHWTG